MSSTQLDHVVLLVTTPFFENPPAWLTDNFTITPGGHHEGQASRNKLIIFADGTYLELFNWYDTPPPLDAKDLPMKVWGPKQPGLIDFALTSTTMSAEECIRAVDQRLTQREDKDLGLGVRFQKPVAGSRKRADGVEVKWRVTRPVFSDREKTPSLDLFPCERIDVPFFCHDVTERILRVASKDVAKTTHACGATGISACEILIPGGLLSEYSMLYGKILGSTPEVAGGTVGGGSFSLDVGVPQAVERSKLVVRAARSEKDIKRLKERGIGFSDLVIATSENLEGGRRSFGSDGIASTIWLESLKE